MLITLNDILKKLVFALIHQSHTEALSYSFHYDCV